MKLLQFTSGGFWLCNRFLEAGTSEAVRSDDRCSTLQIDATELAILLTGVKLASAAKRRKRYA